MPISRMQQPRQMYGLGSLVKSVTKGVKSAVKGVTGAVKDNPVLALAALNFAPMLAGAKPFIGMGSLAGSKYTLPGITSLFGKKAGEATLGKTLGVFAGGSLLGGLLSQAEQQGDPEGITRNVGALKIKLADAYRNQRTFADAEDEEAAIAQQVERDTAEYTQDMARGYAQGGRIGYGMGSLVSNFVQKNPEIFRAIPESKKVSPSSISGMGGILSKFVRNNPQIFMDLNSEEEEENRDMVAMGGRMQYALGTPEQNAMQASEIMDLPLNQNPAGVSELDLRETGGFIPPVGVKEKADDIPAMLSNNEFVFTADAVRGMGDGNVNKGAQRMYDMMKKLEKGGRVV